MGAYIIRRLLLAIIVVFLVSILSFLLIQLVPGDPVRNVLGMDAPVDQVDAMRQELWLDRPVLAQYGHWVDNIFHGNLGDSLLYHQSVISLIGQRLPITLHLSILAILISTIVGIGAGIICAIKRGSILDQFISILANIGVTVPIFWLGILGVYLFGLKLGWLPIQGYTSPTVNFWLNTKQLIMPVICLSLTSLSMIARQTRSSVLEVVRQDYIRTAWSKGLTEQNVISHHVMKNTLIPIVTLIGLGIPVLVGGSVLVETVFNIPGMGRLLVRSLLTKDYPIVQGGVLTMSLLIAFVNLLVDISYSWLDPRVRY
jgi:peptide/nickel transport system permease protein